MAITTVATETWTGTTGASWPSQWTVSVSSGATASATIQSNGGQMSVSSTYDSGSVNAVLTSMPMITDTELLVTISKPSGGSHMSFWINGSGSLTNGGANNPYNGYVLDLYGNADSFYGLDCYSVTGNDVNGGASITDYYNPGFGTDVILRFNRTGNVVKYRIWLSSDTEPSTWNATYTDPAPLGPGVVGVGYINDGASVVTMGIDNLSVTTDDSLSGSATVAWFRV